MIFAIPGPVFFKTAHDLVVFPPMTAGCCSRAQAMNAPFFFAGQMQLMLIQVGAKQTGCVSPRPPADLRFF